ncbi:hypothetical protein [Citrobacter koseri]|uniref:hypothetical protein n=1 Tax=Citrobacter koseri TaxID=545 RepID=UPI001F1771DC|nr:hypothetical protein [Citrobacter koseri]
MLTRYDHYAVTGLYRLLTLPDQEWAGMVFTGLQIALTAAVVFALWMTAMMVWCHRRDNRKWVVPAVLTMLGLLLICKADVGWIDYLFTPYTEGIEQQYSVPGDNIILFTVPTSGIP